MAQNPTGATVKKFNLSPLSEVLGSVTGANYLIKPLLEKDNLSVLFGESGTYKSFVSLDMGLSTAYGLSFQGMPTHQGAVFYICGEGLGGIGRRVKAWLIERSIEDDSAPFFVSNMPAEFTAKHSAEEIAAKVGDLSKEFGVTPALIIIDTLSTNFGDGDESSNKDMARFINHLNIYLRAPYGACVLVVHHVGHGDKNRERGAYALRANTDTRILVERDQDDGCSLNCVKVKDGPHWDSIAFKTKYVVIPDVYDSEGEPTGSLVLEPANYQGNHQSKTLSGYAKTLRDIALELARAQFERIEKANRALPDSVPVLPDDIQEVFYDRLGSQGKKSGAIRNAWYQQKSKLESIFDFVGDGYQVSLEESGFQPKTPNT